MWKCSKLCSHTIACAYQDGCLQEFFAQATGTPSFYALAKASTTTNAGKKPQKLKASSKSSTKAFSKLGEEINLSQSVISGQRVPIQPNLTLQCVRFLPYPFLSVADLRMSPILHLQHQCSILPF